MAFLQCEIFSDALGKCCAFNAIVPQKVQGQIGMTSSGGRASYPVLYLLHGLSDNHTIWGRRTSIERYAAEYNVVIIMPDGGRSFYADMKNGAGKYWTYIAEELPEIVKGMFPVSHKLSDTYAAGLSMGGYGALKLALSKHYAMGASLSGAVDMVSRIDSPDRSWELHLIFGSKKEMIAAGGDLFTLADQCKQAGNMPKIYSVCGTEDFLYEDNLRFKNHLQSLNWPDFTYQEFPGTHNWEFWDHHIQTALKLMFQP